MEMKKLVSVMDNKTGEVYMLIAAYVVGGTLLMVGMLKERSTLGLPIQFAGLVAIGVLKAFA